MGGRRGSALGLVPLWLVEETARIAATTVNASRTASQPATSASRRVEEGCNGVLRVIARVRCGVTSRCCCAGDAHAHAARSLQQPPSVWTAMRCPCLIRSSVCLATVLVDHPPAIQLRIADRSAPHRDVDGNRAAHAAGTGNHLPPTHLRSEGSIASSRRAATTAGCIRRTGDSKCRRTTAAAGVAVAEQHAAAVVQEPPATATTAIWRPPA